MSDTVWLPVLPDMSKFAPELAKGADDAADKQGGKAGKKFGLALTAGVAAVAGGAVIAGKALYDIGATFDDVTDTIRVGTGATGDNLEGLVDSAKRVGTKIPASFEDIGTTVADVNTRLGLTGTTLETFSSQVLEAGRLTGEAIDINKISASFKAFKVEGEATTGAMDTLYRVSQDTGVGMNELATLVQKAGPAVQTLGFDFDQTAALVGGLDKAGLDASKMTAGLSRSLVELSKNGEKPEAAFQRVTGEIEGFAKSGNDAAAIDLASKLFGTKNAPQFVQAIKDGQLSMEDLTAAAKGSGDTILGASEDTADFAEQWVLFKNNVLLIVEPIASRLFGVISDGMKWIVDNGIPALDRWGKAWEAGTGPMGTVKAAMEAVWNGIKNIVPSTDAMSTGFGDLWAKVGPIARQLNDLIAVQWAKWGPTVTNIMKSVGGAVSGGMDIVAKLFQRGIDLLVWAWNTWGATIMKQVGVVFDFVRRVFDGGTKAIAGIFNLFAGILTGDWSRAGKAIQDIASGLWTIVASLFTAGWKTVVNIVTLFWDGVKGLWRVGKDKLGEWTNGLWTAVTDWFRRLKDDVVRYVTGLWDDAKKKWDDAVVTLKNWTNGLWTAVTDWFRRLKDDVVRYVTGLWDDAKKKWDDAVGTLKRWTTDLRDSVTGTVDNMKQRAVDKFNSLKTGAIDAFQKMKDGVKEQWDKVKNIVRDPINAVIRFVNKGVIGSYNWVADKVGLKSMSDVPELPKFASGGYINAPWSSTNRDPYVGYGPDGAPGLRYEGGEFFVRREQTMKHRPLLEAINSGKLDPDAYHLPGYASGGMVKPVNAGHSGWRGGRYRSGKWHGGLDYPIPTGTSVKAVWDGVVTAARRMATSYGHHIKIMHNNGLNTLYAHNSRLMVAANQPVKAGQVIAKSGSTGNSTGPHLHFEVRRGTKQLNPEGFLSGASSSKGFFGQLVEGVTDWFGSLGEKIAGKWDAFKGAIKPKGGGQFFDMGVAMATKVKDDVLNWAKDKLNPFSGAGDNGGSGVQRWRGMVQEVLTAKGLSLAHTDTTLRRMNQESSGNPRAINNWDCLTLDAMILTRRGWLRYDEVQVGDETIGFNAETGKSEWTKITRVVKYEDAEVVTLGNSRWQARGTRNHRWISEPREAAPALDLGDECHICEWPNGVRRRGKSTNGGLRIHLSKAHGIREAQTQRYGAPRFVTTGDINTRDRLALAKFADTGEGLPISDVEAAILGWVAGDGHVEAREHRPTWAIGQVKPAMVEKIRALLVDVPHAEYAYPTKRGTTSHTFRLDYDWVQDLLSRSGHPKRDAESLVLAMSPTQRTAWLQAMIDAEGTIDKDGHPIVYQAAGSVLDAVVLAFYLSGKRPRVVNGKVGHERWVDTFAARGNIPHVTGSSLDISDEGTADVWCVTTELGSWTARQGGHVFLTGNSNARKGTPSKGLMQVIDPTFRAHRDRRYPNNIWDPKANLAASLNYVLARYKSIPAGYNRPGGYWRGTENAYPGLAWVGERGPELVRFRGGEQVYDARTSAALAATGGGLTIGHLTVKVDADELEDVFDFLRSADRYALQGAAR